MLARLRTRRLSHQIGSLELADGQDKKPLGIPPRFDGYSVVVLQTRPRDAASPEQKKARSLRRGLAFSGDVGGSFRFWQRHIDEVTDFLRY